ncbi:hypothetical protein [Butyrivibrio sp. AC2005]|uniref:hypothetical protein n=1 Tax=Butyrivibrio sp. AC2005 TaxID=1280672 RepID=UPI00041C27A7|nr:hypothetical protein [Butyrivibrio sp. AC2005]
MKKRIFASILILLITVSLLPVTAFAADNTEAMYTEDFERATDYAKYAANNDSLKESLIWIEGKAIDFDNVSKSIIVKTAEGNWAAYCGAGGTSNYWSLVQEAVGKDVRVFGKYNGVNPDLRLPEIDFIQSDIYAHAFRLETSDNDFRISYPDYALEVPALDNENTYGDLTFKDSTKLIKNEDADTLFYYFTPDIPAFMLIHAEKLTGSDYDNMSDEEILDYFEEYYNRNSKYVVRKDRANIGGTQGIVCESSFMDASMPSSMCLYCYMTIIDRNYYYFGFTQPYLASETVKRFIPAMLADAKYQGSSATPTSQNDDGPMTEVETEPTTTGNTEPTTSGNTAPKAEDAKKVPSLQEVIGHYTMTIEIISSTGETRKETGENVLWTEKELQGYDESTGVCTLVEDNFVAVITFEYDKDGNIVCHGSLTSGENFGSVIGKKTSD